MFFCRFVGHLIVFLVLVKISLKLSVNEGGGGRERFLRSSNNVRRPNFASISQGNFSCLSFYGKLWSDLSDWFSFGTFC